MWMVLYACVSWEEEQIAEEAEDEDIEKEPDAWMRTVAGSSNLFKRSSIQVGWANVNRLL